MKPLTLVALTAIASLTYGTADAQVVTIVTTPPGSFTHSIASAMAKVMVEKEKLRATVSPQQSHGQEAVNDGSAELSLATLSDVQQYVTGTVDWEGRGRKEDIRIVGRLVPIMTAGYVKLDSDIKSLKDVKGKRIASDLPAHRAVRRVILSQLAGAGLTEQDVRGVPSRNIITAADDFAAGKTDIFWFALGSAKVRQVAASVGGLRAIPIETSPEAVAAMNKWVPGSYPVVLKPSPQLEEIRMQMPVQAYDVVLFTNAKLADDLVYKMTRAVHENRKDMGTVFAVMNRFEPDKMATEYEHLVYHAGAIRYYKEKGLWPPRRVGS